jgi:hypothetical protein
MRAPGWAAAALLVLLPSVGEAQRADPGALADARRGIDRGNAQYIAAFGRADADGVAEVYDADGVRLNEDGRCSGAGRRSPGTCGRCSIRPAR